MKRGTKFVAVALAASMTMPVAAGLAGCSKGEEAGFASVSQTTLTDPYAVNALEKELDYLLSLEPDKLLADFRTNAGLAANATPYGGGWEGALMGGHTLGHYLSALSQAYANAGTDETSRAALKTRIDGLVAGLKECQDNAVNAGAFEGFIWGAHQTNMAPEAQFDNVENNKTNIVTEAWVPWYTMHKLIAGLIDVYTYMGSKEAFDVVKKLGMWVYYRTQRWDDYTALTVLSIEYGGMNDCMYTLYRLTGEEKYAVAAHAFDEERLFDDILSERADYLNNLHANTTIPKVIGALNRYLTLHQKTVGGVKVDASRYLEVAEKFWTRVVEHHTYITGANSEWEHFGYDDVLDGERTNANCETCNVYNMLKLSRALFFVTRDKKYLDYYENAYINDILSSQNPETGMTTYFQPMATGYFKVYSTPTGNFWCCTGSGMESFTKLNDSIYFLDGDTAYVSLYLSSVLETERGKLVQEADLENSDVVTIRVERGSFELRLRRPDWTEKFSVKVDGEAAGEEQDGFVCLSVTEGDTVEITFEKTVKAYALPDGANVYAFKYGPYVLSAELGTAAMTTGTTGVNVTIPASKDLGGFSETVRVSGDLSAYMQEISSRLVRGEDGKFRLTGADQALVYSVHFRQHTERYGLYFRFIGSGDEAAPEEDVWTTVDTMQPGYGQYEKGMDDNGSVGSTSDAEAGGTSRYATAGGSFTYWMKVKAGEENYLVFYLAKADNGKNLRIVSGNAELYNETLSYTGDELIYEVRIKLPASVVNSASSHSIPLETLEGVVPFTFSGEGGSSARLASFVYIQTAR